MVLQRSSQFEDRNPIGDGTYFALSSSPLPHMRSYEARWRPLLDGVGDMPAGEWRKS